eukprot:CAMPEP_0197473040 /NCGR_PEP_ID=MMETSP1309-20131121/4334_1 /TAXON_ID=464262 /ORGANISM="Genus nov. species nov., Strain RCC998" /LENGTH=148 /DNA_ID=CAMNT_0043011949 /DNA_START=308 /DNA_END=754 /DNA_ORIENTATION=-
MSSTATAAASDGKNNRESGVLLQYVVLRRDLWQQKEENDYVWPLGAVVAQGCHASTAALWLSKDDNTTKQYCSEENIDNMHKAVLEVKSETQLRNLSEKLQQQGIKHKLWIEQPENYATCLATAPLLKATMYPILKKYNLCKASIGQK